MNVTLQGRETSIQALNQPLPWKGLGKRPEFIWGHNSVASCAGISSLGLSRETSRVDSCVSMVLKAKYRTDGAILWFGKITFMYASVCASQVA